MAESDISIKRCTACGEVKPLDCFNFNSRNKTDGRHSWCKPCKRAYYQKRWAEATPEVRTASAAATLARIHADPEAHRARSLEWKGKNRDKVNARARELRKLFPERELARRLRSTSVQKSARRLASKRYRERHPERVKECRTKYQRENPEKYALWARNRRARTRKVGGSHTIDDIEILFSAQRGKCACCRIRLKRYHVDHIVSLAAGGSNDRKNLQLLCPSCNQQKHARDPIEFMQSRGFLL